MVVGKVRGGGQIMVGEGDGGIFTAPPGTDPNWKEKEAAEAAKMSGGAGPQAYGLGVGEKLDGKYPPEKR